MTVIAKSRTVQRQQQGEAKATQGLVLNSRWTAIL